MSEKVLVGEDAFAALVAAAEAQANGVKPVPKEETAVVVESPPVAEEKLAYKEEWKPRPVELPIGFRFVDLKQKHMIAFIDNVDLSKDKKHKSPEHLNDYICRGAIKAGWFEMPKDIQEDDAGDFDMQIADVVSTAIVNKFVNVRNTPKN